MPLPCPRQCTLARSSCQHAYAAPPTSQSMQSKVPDDNMKVEGRKNKASPSQPLKPVLRSPETEPTESAEDDALWVDEEVLREENEAREAREKEAAKAKPAGELTREKLDKLDKLVDQATMYSQFLGEQVNNVRDKWEQVLF